MPTLLDASVKNHQLSLTNPIKFSSRLVLLTLVSASLHGVAHAQAPSTARPETVSWTVQPQTALKPGSRVALTLKGEVLAGWHVYSLKQLPDGPTPLSVTLDANSVAKADGAATGSPPQKIRDAAFGLDTQFYADTFSLTVPVRLKPNLKPGQQQIPISVRFQTCNGSVCQPPKTVHLSASVTLQAGG
jgi:hypothetical protein